MAKGKKTSKGGKGRRRSKAENMTGAKEGEVEVRTPAIGDNSQLAMPEPDDWNHHRKSIKGWQEKVTTAQSGLRNAKKAAKKAGINLEAFDLVVGIERKNDPVATMNFFRQVDLGLSLSEESTLRISPHDTLAGDEMDLVYKRGFADGKAGRTADNKYPEGSSLAEQYAKGWRHGTASNLGMAPEESDAAVEGEPEKIAAE